ncbi:A24 family peptidase [Paenibacillus wynnii]|uniref:Peptidase A24 n=1 Tax=Paenibacillus wynnii TaxID=268407 RepID=A0A098MAF1_9BACL|nr:A24 family peptidase [Paenibacillus wynnii]KGE19036.1 peptidase A24 [Paenibacillus wynnii]
MTEWAFWGCTPFLAAALFTDIRSMRIPNWITVPAFFTGLVLQALVQGWQGFLFAICGAAAGFALLLIMHFMGAVGAGDVKLFAGIGAWTGMLFTAQVIMYSVFIGALIGWIIVLWRHETGTRLRNTFSKLAVFFVLHDLSVLKGRGKEQLRFPFMLAVIPGSVCAYLYF